MRLRFVTVLCLFVLGACQSGDNVTHSCHCSLHDADLPDSNEQEVCDPMSQDGCEAGEKCAQLAIDNDPFLARTGCVPDGAVPLGGACLSGDATVSGSFSNCIGGTECINETCREICTTEPDSCRSVDDSFGSGEDCAFHAGYFSDVLGVGLCVSACDPSDDSLVDGELVNASCNEGDVCTLTGCARAIPEAQEATQNRDCHGTLGGCFENGCASGFTPQLPNSPDDTTGRICARFCSPVNSHASAMDAIEGANGNCSAASLNELGGTNGETSAHQCRFLQSFSPLANRDQTPAEIGFCVPTLPAIGGTWGDCAELDWDAIKVAWQDGAADPAQREKDIENLCLSEPSQPPQFEDVCLALRRGCISLQEIDLGFAP